jgi:hypothetical protein
MAPVPTFGERGSVLHTELLAAKSYNPAEMVLVVEACRMADRLESINDLVASKGLANLLHLRRMDDFGEEEGEVVIKVTIDSVLAEGRQLQLAFQRIVTALGIKAGASATAKGKLSDDLAARRANRIAAAAGS